MTFVNDQMDLLVGGSQDFPQRMLEQNYAQNSPLAFAPVSGPQKSYKKIAEATPAPIEEIKEEQENLSDRLDKLEAETTSKPKSAKGFFQKHQKKIKTGILIGIALYAGYRLFLKGRIKFGHGGHASADPMPPMESGGEITSAEI